MSDPLWNYVKLLMHCDGVDGSLRVVNERHAAFTLLGNTAISTLEKKFGGASLRFDGANDYAYTELTSSGYAIGAGVDFAVEFFAFPRETANASPVAVSIGTAPNSSAIWIGYDWATAAGKWGFFNGATSTTVPVLVSTSSVVYDQWVHIAVTRSGSTVRLFVNGTIEATTTFSGAMAPGAPFIWLSGGAAANNYYGYLDEIRYTVGAARYTADFTPPTAPFEQGDPVYDLDYDKVVFHCHADGEHGAATFTDQKGHAITKNGSVSITTTLKKFGGSAISYVTAALNGYIQASATDLDLGSGDFTVEFFLYNGGTTASVTGMFEFMADDGVTPALAMDRQSNLFASNLIVMGTTLTGFVSFASGAWEHIAFVKSGGTLSLFKNGTLAGSTTTNVSSMNFNGVLRFAGRQGFNSCPAYYDEIRITKGFARYTGSFTPPSEPFPDYMPQKLTGTVRDSAGNPIARTVRAYRSSDGLLVDSAVSDGVTGGFSLRATDLSEHFVVVHDPVKNALVYDHITPVL